MDNGTIPPQHDGVDSDNVDTLAARSVSKNGEDASRTSHRQMSSGDILGSVKSSTDYRAPNQKSQPKGDEEISSERSDYGASIENALNQSQGRKKSPSSRKATMLGTQNPDRSSSPSAESSIVKPASLDDTANTNTEPSFNKSTQHKFNYEQASLNPSSDSGFTPETTTHVATSAVSNPQSTNDQGHSTSQLLESHITGPSNIYASTTDDDEGVSFFHTTVSNSLLSYKVAQVPSRNSAMSLHRRLSNRSGQPPSHNITHIPVSPALEEEWDYSETEWWGWAILIATWVVFVVGMGSCLGVWSWAWDVGETPYAPPELEDDPTLPILGYYPALMVCTAVMAWVWVVVAWVGMKYFRHSKVVVEDG